MSSPDDPKPAMPADSEATSHTAGAPEGARVPEGEVAPPEAATSQGAAAEGEGSMGADHALDRSDDASPEASSELGVPVASIAGSRPEGKRPTFLFFGVVAAISLVLDVVTKVCAELTITARAQKPIELIEDHLNITLAYNEGGAWGLLANHDELIRKPFFLGVSLLAIVFIVSLYGRLMPGQRALKWGLPLVLGGALGNLADRIVRGKVIDFLDFRADWVLAMNQGVKKFSSSWTLTDHWPTFNVADIAICIGVGLMAMDMFTSRKLKHPPAPRLVDSKASPAEPEALEQSSALAASLESTSEQARGLESAANVPSSEASSAESPSHEPSSRSVFGQS